MDRRASSSPEGADYLGEPASGLEAPSYKEGTPASDEDEDIDFGTEWPRVSGTPISKEGAEWSGQRWAARRAPSHHHTIVYRLQLSSGMVADTEDITRTSDSLLKGYACLKLSAQPRNFGGISMPNHFTPL